MHFIFYVQSYNEGSTGPISSICFIKSVELIEFIYAIFIFANPRRKRSERGQERPHKIQQCFKP